MLRRVWVFCVAISVLGSADLARSQDTQCLSEETGGPTAPPAPVVAGMTRMYLISPGSSFILNESFFDSAAGPPGDSYSHAANFRAGYTQCDQNPDVRAMWGYEISDESTTTGGLMALTVSAWSQQTAQAPSGTTCTTVSGPRVWHYSIDTLPGGADRLVSDGGSFVFGWNLSGCDAQHDWFQVRMRGQAQAPNLPASVDTGCFVVPWRDTCPGVGANCL